MRWDNSVWYRRDREDKTKRLLSLLACYKANCCFLVFSQSTTELPPSKFSSCLELLVCTTAWFVLLTTPLSLRHMHPSSLRLGSIWVPWSKLSEGSGLGGDLWLLLPEAIDIIYISLSLSPSSSPPPSSSSSTTPINIPPQAPAWLMSSQSEDTQSNLCSWWKNESERGSSMDSNRTSWHQLRNVESSQMLTLQISYRYDFEMSSGTCVGLEAGQSVEVDQMPERKKGT